MDTKLQSDFAQDPFKPEQYVRQLLKDNTEAGQSVADVWVWHRTQHQRSEYSQASQELQRNVLRNYGEFIKISTEINQLSNDIQSVRGVLEHGKRYLNTIVSIASDVAADDNPASPSPSSLEPSPTAGIKEDASQQGLAEILVRQQILHVTDLPALSQPHAAIVSGSTELLEVAEIRDDLTAHLALREFDEAVDLYRQSTLFIPSEVVDQLKHIYALADVALKTDSSVLRNQMQTLRDKLVGCLVAEVIDTSTPSPRKIKRIQAMCLLGEIAEAQKTPRIFLLHHREADNRSLILQWSRHIHLDGSDSAFLDAASQILADILTSSFDIFQSLFGPAHLPTFLDWSFLVWQQFQQTLQYMVTDQDAVKHFMKEAGPTADALRDIGLDFIWQHASRSPER